MALTDYSWDGLWRASFSGSPWNGTASAGGSATQELSEVTTPPGTGTAVNGLTPARFDGTDDFLTLEGVDTDYLATGAFTLHAVLKPLSYSAPQTYYWDEPCLLVQPGSAGIAIGVSSSGVGLEVYDSGGAQQTARAALHTGLNVVQAVFNGTTAKIRTNGGSWQSVAADSVYLGGLALEIGRDYIAAAHLNTDLFEFAIANTALSDANLDDCLEDAELTYGLVLLPNAATILFGGSCELQANLTTDPATIVFGGTCTSLQVDLTTDPATIVFGGSCALAEDELLPNAATIVFGGSCSSLQANLSPNAATIVFGGSCSVTSDVLLPNAATIVFGGSCSVESADTARVYSASLALRQDVTASGFLRLSDEYRNGGAYKPSPTTPTSSIAPNGATITFDGFCRLFGDESVAPAPKVAAVALAERVLEAGLLRLTDEYR